MNSGLEARFARRTHKGLGGFIPSLRERLLSTDVARAEFAVGSRGYKVTGAKALRIQLIFDERLARKMQDPDGPQSIAR